MKKRLIAVLAAASLMITLSVCAEENTLPETTAMPAAEITAAPTAEPVRTLALTTQYRWFVNRYRYTRGVTVTYYDNVYAYNHGEYGLTPFAYTVPEEYFIEDDDGNYALAPIVLDITDAMRERLYGGDVGETVMYYGQYCDRIRDKIGRVGFSGVHEGIDFINRKGCALYAIWDGVITRAGDSNGTVAIYNEEYDATLLYLHCKDIKVKRGDTVKAGDLVAKEGNKNSGSAYTHVEFRLGRHTSSSPYRDTKLTSDCPYAVMQAALGVEASGRQPVTRSAVLQAQRMRREAEAAALAAAQAEAEAAAHQAEAEATPAVELIDVLPGAAEGYGFSEATPAPAAEATLPPSKP